MMFNIMKCYFLVDAVLLNKLNKKVRYKVFVFLLISSSSHVWRCGFNHWPMAYSKECSIHSYMFNSIQERSIWLQYVRAIFVVIFCCFYTIKLR